MNSNKNDKKKKISVKYEWKLDQCRVNNHRESFQWNNYPECLDRYECIYEQKNKFIE